MLNFTKKKSLIPEDHFLICFKNTPFLDSSHILQFLLLGVQRIRVWHIAKTNVSLCLDFFLLLQECSGSVSGLVGSSENKSLVYWLKKCLEDHFLICFKNVSAPFLVLSLSSNLSKSSSRWRSEGGTASSKARPDVIS